MISALIRKIIGQMVLWGALLVIGWAGIGETYGQATEVELLEALKTTPEEDHDSLYYELFRLTLYNNLPAAKEYGFRAYYLSKRFEHNELLTKACRGLGLVFHRMYKSDSAGLFYEEGIEVGTRNGYKKILVYIYNDRGRLFESLGVYDSALRYYNLSLENAASAGLEEDQSFALNNKGLLFYYLGDLDEALKHYDLSLEIKRKLGLPLYSTLLNISLVQADLGNSAFALEILQHILKECEEDCDGFLMTDMYHSLGYLYLGIGNLDAAQGWIKKSLDIGSDLGYEKKEAYSRKLLAKIDWERKNLAAAITNLEVAERLSIQLKLNANLKEIYQLYVQIYSMKNDFYLVSDYQDKLIKISEAIINGRIAVNLMNIHQANMKKQSDLALQQKEDQLTLSRLIIFFIIVIAVLFVAVSVLMYSRNRLNKRLKQILEKQVQLRTSDLLQNNTKLKQLNTEFEALLKQTSKYIRGPLASLIGLIELVEKDQYDPERTREYLEKIKKLAGSMGLSLDQLKEVGRMRTGKNNQLRKGSALEELLGKNESDH